MLDASLKWSDDTELVGLVFTVSPKKDVALPTSYAKGLHAWFLNQVQKKDPQLSQYLHDAQSEKAFTMSRLFGEIAENDNQLILREDRTYQWYISALSQPVARWLRHWLHNFPKFVILLFKQLANSPFPDKIYLSIKSVAIAFPATTYSNLFKTAFKKKALLEFLKCYELSQQGTSLSFTYP